jgi:hypothetical protein
MSEFRLICGRGSFQVHAHGRLVGEDLVISIWGGNRPHVGTVAIALPRKSLREPEKVSSTSSVFTLLGHKEDIIAKEFSEKLSSALNKVVVVTVGIHQDRIDQRGIDKFIDNCDRAFGEVLRVLKKAQMSKSKCQIKSKLQSSKHKCVI